MRRAFCPKNKKMDLKNWKRYKRSGTYRREVDRRFEKATSSSSNNQSSDSSQNQVGITIMGNGSVQNVSYKDIISEESPYSSNFSE